MNNEQKTSELNNDVKPTNDKSSSDVKKQSNDINMIIIYFIGLIACVGIFVVSIKLFGDKTISFSKEENKVSESSTTKKYEDTKKDVFIQIAKSYISEVNLSVLINDLKCSNDDVTWIDINKTPLGENNIYYFMVDTGSISNGDVIKEKAQEDTASFYGGKSPFSNNNMIGYVLWTRNSNSKSDNVYKIKLVDEDRNGLKEATLESDLKGDLVLIGKANFEDKPKKEKGNTYYRCILE